MSPTPQALVNHALRATRLPRPLSPLLLLLALAALAPVRAVRAQDPSGEELLQASGLTAQQVRDRIRSSGLTADQVRGRLSARGLPATALDAFLGGNNTFAPGLEPAPSPQVLTALAVLGSMDRAAQVAATAQPDSAPPPATMDSLGLPIFGLSLFHRSTNQFEPQAAGPVDAAYRLGPLDVLSLVLTGQVELAHTLEVTRDGLVIIPQVGQAFVGNLTLEQATRVIVAKLRRSYAGAGLGADAPTRVYLSVARLRVNQVFVIGDVASPGSFQISAAGTALTALYAAGGPSSAGSLRRIDVRRGGHVVSELDIYDYLLRGDNSRDVRLENGDVLFVHPATRRVALTGAVVRPARYEIRDGESLTDLVRMAGGLLPDASVRRLEVHRILPAADRTAARDRTRLDVSGPELAAGVVPALPIVGGDSIRVLGVERRVRDVISLHGNVWAPGEFAWRDGMTFHDAMLLAGGLADSADVQDSVLITRQNPDRTLLVLTRPLRDPAGGFARLALMPSDSVRVLRRSQFRIARTIFVSGAVRKPREIPWAEGLTLRRAILEAGGLQEWASLDEVEIARFPEGERTDQLATALRVPIDSTYLTDRDATGRYLGPQGRAARASGTPEVPLRPYDQVNVLMQSGWERSGAITITGEVRFPGSYAILRRGETIRELVARAGGLTADAYVDGALYFRRADSTSVRARNIVLSQLRRAERYEVASQAARAAAQTGTAVAPASGDWLNSLMAAIPNDTTNAQRISLDLADAIRDTRSPSNLAVMPQDEIHIPRRPGTVEVRGLVATPVTVSHRPGLRLSAYIALAGGATSAGDPHRAFVLQPNGDIEPYRSHRLWLDRDPVVRPGASVIVPPAAVRLTDPTRSLPVVVSALSSLVTAAVAIVTLSK